MSRRQTSPRFVILVLAALAAAGHGCTSAGPGEKPPEIEKGRCSPLTREVLDASLALGTRYILNHQQPDGRYSYIYDWVERARGNYAPESAPLHPRPW